MTKIAVATITLNEEMHIRRWAESAEDADALVIADTGSHDATLFEAERLGVEVHTIRVNPWRFDVARNALYALLPDWVDWVISLDADEVLTPGWRTAMERAIAAEPEARRLSYLYTWSWVAGLEGKVPDVQFHTDKCTTRFGWMWKGPCHEVLVPAGSDTRDAVKVHGGFGIEHYSDSTKSRSSYLGLLEQAVVEEPHNPRQSYYLGREYYFNGMWDKARAELVRFLALPDAKWGPERASAWRLIARMDDDPERWLLRAVAEVPGRREPWVDLTYWYYEHSRLEEAAGTAARALSIRERQYDYLTEAGAWNDAELRKIAGWVPEDEAEETKDESA